MPSPNPPTLHANAHGYSNGADGYSKMALGTFSMRNTFKLSVLAAALALAGCVGGTNKPVELSTIGPQSQYDQQIQDSLGDQRTTEAQMLYQRRFNDFQGQINELEEKRKNLDAALNQRAYESGVAEAPASASEAGRIKEYQEAARASQSRVAEESSKYAIQQSLIENKRDKAILEAESRAAKRIADIELQSSKELQQTEDRLRQDIDGRKSFDTAARLEESKKFDEQRITLLLANADAERQANDKLTSETNALARIRSESEGRIADLNRQISALQAQLQRTEADDGRAIALQQSKVAGATTESERLAGISRQLKSSTAAANVNASVPNSDFVQVKESELARVRTDAEARKTQRIADVNSGLAQEKNDIISHARTEIASISSRTEMAKATVLAPVVTGRAVYADNYSAGTAVKTPTPPSTTLAPQPKPVPAKVNQAPAPVLTISRFEPKVNQTPSQITNDEIGGAVIAGGSGVAPPSAQGGAAPLRVAIKSRPVYEVLYVFKDEASWTKFQQFLQAYGITEIYPSRNNKAGEFLIYCGRYYDEDQAASRVTYLNKTTATKHALVRLTQVPL
ncbi:hypothetical protein ABH908_000461 [Pseudomonas frederiksbergensis]|uniref:hypothetical protein n=1 Tax=Pseudomonas TaxID=286 RepID=UPI003D220EF9